MVGGADQGGALYLLEAFLHAQLLVALELLGGDVLGYVVVAVRGLEVLADGEDLATDGTEVVHQFLHLLGGLAQAHHDACLAGDATLCNLLKHAEAGVVAGHAPHLGGEAADGLHVVGNDVGLSVNDLLHQFAVALEVGYQHLHGGVGVGLLDLADGLGPVGSAQVGQVVAVHAGDDGMAQLHQLHAVGHVLRLGWVKGQGATRLRVAEAAATGADVPANHEGGRSASPAFTHVGAAPTAADGVQAVGLHDAFRFCVALVGADAYLQPLGLAYSLLGFHLSLGFC